MALKPNKMLETKKGIHRLTALLLFIFSFLIYFLTDKTTPVESQWTVRTAISIIKNHNTNLDEYRELAQAQQFEGVDQINGHLYAHYPITPVIIALPFVWVSYEFSQIIHYDFISSIAIGGGKKCELFIAAFLTALSVILIYLIAKKFLTNRLAILSALIFAFCTPAWSTASTGLTVQSITLLISCILIFLLIKDDIKPITVAIIGFTAAIGCMTSPIYILIFILVVGFVFLKFQKYFLWLGAALLVIIPLFIYNSSIYYSLFGPTFYISNFSGDNALIAMLGNLISPARGIIIYSPIILFAIIGIYLLAAHKKLDACAWLFLIIICTGYILISCQFIWWGGWHFGAAELTCLFPFLIYFLILFFKWMKDQQKSMPVINITIIALAVLSLFINYRGAASTAVAQWNFVPADVNEHTERLWQFNDLPFLRFKISNDVPVKTAIAPSGFTIDNTTFDKVKYPATLYDKKYLLQLLPDNFYIRNPLQQSFQKTSNAPDSSYTTNTGVNLRLEPFGYNEGKNFLFEFTYPSEFQYTFLGKTPKIPVVSFPHPDLTPDFAWAVIKLKNTTSNTKTIFVRLFYQNTSYWFPINDSLKNDTSNLDNFYGCSAVLKVTLNGNESGVYKIPYKIGFDPKNKLSAGNKWRISARPGNYEFMAITSEHEDDPLMSSNLNLNKVNPFAIVKNDELQNNGKQYFNNMAYVGAHHFKFVFADDDFDGHNDLRTTAVYIAKDHSQKPLCDTCKGNWFKDVISDNWTDSEFFQGNIFHANKIQAEYGSRKENFYFDNGKAIIKIPGSTPQKKQKTWGEFMFEPSFKYGHVMVRAKFAQMFNKAGRPNGIIHNLWLYQRDFIDMPPDPKNPYHNLTNAQGNQPFEIDFEIWSSRYASQAWDNKALINYSVVDYMRDPNVDVKPGEQKKVGKYSIDRLNNVQANIPSAKFDNKFFDYYHLYEVYWTPTSIRYLLDGVETAYFTNKDVKIPDQELYLWIGSPLYQDGTYFSQTDIPFIPNDMFSEIDWIRIE